MNADGHGWMYGGGILAFWFFGGCGFLSADWLALRRVTATGGRGFMGRLINSFAFGVVGEEAPAIWAEARLDRVADGQTAVGGQSHRVALAGEAEVAH